MHYIQDSNGLKLLGMGQAVVIEVRSGSVNVHQVRINHPDFGETNFIPYVQTAGLLKVPAIGDVVYVFCREGFHSYPMAWGTKLHDSAVQALLGSVRNNATVIYSTDSSNKVSHTIILDEGENRGIRIKTAGGNSIEVKNNEDITLTQVNGNTLKMSSAGIDIESAGDINLKGKNVNIEASGSTVKVGAQIEVKASDNLAKVDNVTISTHQHTGNIGLPTSAPLPG
jgi:hypothetical protein